jgi:multicomponent Na+:H+ antiporter subunit B
VTPTAVEVVLVVFVIGAAVAATLLRDILAAVMAFAAYSLGMSIIWIVLQAPDVGLTEAAVGAGVMTILFLLALAGTVRPDHDRLFERVDPGAVVVVLAVVLLLFTTLPALPAVGDPDAAATSGDVTQYYLTNAYEETGVHNAVTAVLASYRGLDTLGEAVVVFTAGVATVGVLGRRVLS